MSMEAWCHDLKRKVPCANTWKVPVPGGWHTRRMHLPSLDVYFVAACDDAKEQQRSWSALFFLSRGTIASIFISTGHFSYPSIGCACPLPLCLLWTRHGVASEQSILPLSNRSLIITRHGLYYPWCLPTYLPRYLLYTKYNCNLEDFGQT